MKHKTFARSAALLLAFALWTAAVRCVDVQPIGPCGSSVGFAAVNGAFHGLTGVHWWLYNVTDWLGLVPIGFVLGFGVFGLVQWMCRRSLVKVDADILILGGFYLVVLAAYLLFEMVAINYRPVLVEGFLEASYPSSTTLLVLCVMPSVMLQFHRRLPAGAFKTAVQLLLAAFTVFMAVGRLISGVHWLSDIIGSVLLSGGLVLLYAALTEKTTH